MARKNTEMRLEQAVEEVGALIKEKDYREAHKNILGAQGGAFVATISQMSTTISEFMDHQGFWDYEGVPNELVKQVKIGLIHTELSEMFEGIRKGNPQDDHVEELTSEEAELADVLVRVLDYAGYYRINLGAALVQKMMFNLTRERKHGKTN